MWNWTRVIDKMYKDFKLDEDQSTNDLELNKVSTRKNVTSPLLITHILGSEASNPARLR